MTGEEVQFHLVQRAKTGPQDWVVVFGDGKERKASWEEVALWVAVANLSARVQELEADA